MQSKRTALLTLSILPAAILFVSCETSQTAFQNVEPSIDIPNEWQSKEAQTSANRQNISSWWAEFDDPVLTKLIENVLAANPDIRSALSKIEESRARYGIERAALLPTVSASVGGRQSESRDHNTDTTSNSESYSASVDASWEIDLFGTQRLSAEAAKASYLQTEANFASVQASLAAEVASAYISLRETQTQLRVLQENLEIRESTAQITQWKEESGINDALQTQQALTSLQQARASLPSLQQTLEQNKNQLSLLCGKNPGELDTLLDKTGSVPTAPANIAIGIPADTLRQRPDIQAAEYALQSSALLAENAKRDRLPSLKLSGSLGIDALKAGDLLSPESSAASLVESITAPIFQAGRIKKSIAVQLEQLEQAKASYDSLLLNALTEVENALVAVQRAQERADLLDKAALSAAEAAKLANAQYEAGQVDILTVLDAQRTLLSTQEQKVSGISAQSNALITLYKSLGGGWVSADAFANIQR